MSFGVVDANCILCEVDFVVSVTYWACAYEVFLEAWHYMARYREVGWEVCYGQLAVAGGLLGFPRGSAYLNRGVAFLYLYLGGVLG